MKEINKTPVVVIIGQTAVGKTKLAIKLARKINGEIISADSMQVYKDMDIGTAKSTKSEMKKARHHLVDIVKPSGKWNVSLFLAKCKKLIGIISKNGKIPIITGGTGLYLWGLVEGLSLPLGKPNLKLRKQLEKKDSAKLYAKLIKIDNVAALKIHPNDKKRLIRALEVSLSTKRPISALQKKKRPENIKYILVGLNINRDKLYKNIDMRVDKMLNKGLVGEVSSLLKKGYKKSLTAFQALGYKEVIAYLDGQHSKEEMAAELKKRTRNFARRQMTWFKRFKDIAWFNAESPSLLKQIESHLKGMLSFAK